MTGYETDIAHLIWDSRYRYRDENDVAEHSIEDTWSRVARAVASVEQENAALWEQRFFEVLRDFRFLPGGRILYGAGTGHDVTLFNCFVMGPIGDSMGAIFDALKEGAVTLQQGGGVGYDFSTLRPAGSVAHRVGTVASGPVSFMRVWNSMCDTLLSTASRRGAMMATLRCDHPDIESFVDAKRDPRELRNFNLSVLVTDAFMEAVDRDADWPLVFPVAGLGGARQVSGLAIEHRAWSGSADPVPCVVLQRIAARDLWGRIMRAAYDTAEPGVLFIDRINRENNLGYREHISATNPCGELPLPPYGACDLGSLNLVRFVTSPFTEQTDIDWSALDQVTAVAVRFMDNVIDLSRFPFEAQARQARGSRRIGLGITGLASSLAMLGLHYDSRAARDMAANLMQHICHSAYRASIELGREKGVFPFFARGALLESLFVHRLPRDIHDSIALHGLRNSHLTAIAPAGTISLFAGNVSSGIEPVFEFDFRRRARGADGEYTWYRVTDYAVRNWRERFGGHRLPAWFADAQALPPAAHLGMQAALQPWVDSAISKTVNVPQAFPFEEFRGLYHEAYRLGLKGCATFRPNEITGVVLASGDETATAGPASHCCSLEREGD